MQIAHYRIRLKDQEFNPNLYRGMHNLISLEVDLGTVGSVDRARMVFGGCGDLHVSLDDPVEIELGDQDGKQTVFRGDVSHLVFHGTHIVLEAQKPERKLLSLCFDQLFEKQTSGDIVRWILKKAGLEAGRIEEGIAFPYYPLSAKQSGYEHIRDLAEKNDFLSFMDPENRFHFGAVLNRTPVRTFKYQAGILSLRQCANPPLRQKFLVYGEGAASVKGEKAAHWLHDNWKDYEGSIGSGSAWTETDYSLRNKKSAMVKSRNLALSAIRKTIRGEMKTLGAADVFPGYSIGIADSPVVALNRAFLVTAVRHIFNRVDGFVSVFRFCER